MRVLFTERRVWRILKHFSFFLSATEYHSDADYNSRRVGVVVVVVIVVVVVVVTDFKKWITFLCFDPFG